jgi:hypothetical protein
MAVIALFKPDLFGASAGSRMRWRSMATRDRHITTASNRVAGLSRESRS